MNRPPCVFCGEPNRDPAGSDYCLVCRGCDWIKPLGWGGPYPLLDRPLGGLIADRGAVGDGHRPPEEWQVSESATAVSSSPDDQRSEHIGAET